MAAWILAYLLMGLMWTCSLLSGHGSPVQRGDIAFFCIAGALWPVTVPLAVIAVVWMGVLDARRRG